MPLGSPLVGPSARGWLGRLLLRWRWLWMTLGGMVTILIVGQKLSAVRRRAAGSRHTAEVIKLEGQAVEQEHIAETYKQEAAKAEAIAVIHEAEADNLQARIDAAKAKASEIRRQLDGH